MKFEGVSQSVDGVVAFFDFDFVFEEFANEVGAAFGDEDSGLSACVSREEAA